MKPLNRSFYAKKPTEVARNLIGKHLIRQLPSGRILGGIIVETEAYGGRRDPASHAFRGMTPRNHVMFGEAGHTYVYFTYGFHHCLNFVTGKKGIASAVLIRAIEPTIGLEYMEEIRGNMNHRELTNGPGKLCQALSIDRTLNGCDVTDSKSPVKVYEGDSSLVTVNASFRVGITKGVTRKWRFFAESNEFVSKIPRGFSRERES